MIILRGKNFSEKKKRSEKLDMRDEDHLNDLEQGRVKKRHIAGLSAASALVGGAFGAAAGSELAKNAVKGSKVGAAVGAAALGTGALLAGNALRKSANKKLDTKIDRYKNSSKSDRKYLRERYNEERRRREHEAMLAATMAPKHVYVH